MKTISLLAFLALTTSVQALTIRCESSDGQVCEYQGSERNFLLHFTSANQELKISEITGCRLDRMNFVLSLRENNQILNARMTFQKKPNKKIKTVSEYNYPLLGMLAQVSYSYSYSSNGTGLSCSISNR